MLTGSLAPRGAVVKVAGLSKEQMRFEGIARVFDGEDGAMDAILTGSVVPGTVLVIRRGPRVLRVTRAELLGAGGILRVKLEHRPGERPPADHHPRAAGGVEHPLGVHRTPHVPVADHRHGRVLAVQVVVGADGSRSICRQQIPASERRDYFREYPFAWFGERTMLSPGWAQAGMEDLICLG